MKEYLNKLKIELTMAHMHDGWTINWLKSKIKQIEKSLKINS
mgnify:CR=1 FL=1|jgi:hypothetical protein